MAKTTIKEIVDLWHETQIGHYLKCQKKQYEFADMMWELRDEIYDPMTGWGNGDDKNGKQFIYILTTS